MKWFSNLLLFFLFIQPDAQALLTTLRAEHPVLGVESLWLSTIYDSEKFRGYTTQGVKYISVSGTPFFILFEEIHQNMSDAFLAHERARAMMISFYLDSLKNEQNLLLIREDVDGDVSTVELSNISELSLVDSPRNYPYMQSDTDSDADDAD